MTTCKALVTFISNILQFSITAMHRCPIQAYEHLSYNFKGWWEYGKTVEYGGGTVNVG